MKNWKFQVGLGLLLGAYLLRAAYRRWKQLSAKSPWTDEVMFLGVAFAGPYVLYSAYDSYRKRNHSDPPPPEPFEPDRTFDIVMKIMGGFVAACGLVLIGLSCYLTYDQWHEATLFGFRWKDFRGAAAGAGLGALFLAGGRSLAKGSFWRS